MPTGVNTCTSHCICSNERKIVTNDQRRIRFGRALCRTLIVFVTLFPLYGFITTPLLLGTVFVSSALFDSIRAIFMGSYRKEASPINRDERDKSAPTIFYFLQK